MGQTRTTGRGDGEADRPSAPRARHLRNRLGGYRYGYTCSCGETSRDDPRGPEDQFPLGEAHGSPSGCRGGPHLHGNLEGKKPVIVFRPDLRYGTFSSNLDAKRAWVDRVHRPGLSDDHVRRQFRADSQNLGLVKVAKLSSPDRRK